MELKEGNWVFLIEYEFLERDMPHLIENGKKLQELSKKEPGCIHYQFHFAEGTKNKVFLYQAFINENALNEHVETDHFRDIAISKLIPKIVSRKVTRLFPLISST